MFGKSKPVVFEPYGRRRSRWPLPRWLVLLLLGIALGAGGLYYAQQRYLPPRLSAAETAQLRTSFEQVSAERTRLANELEDTTKRLDAAVADRQRLDDELTASRESTEGLREVVASVLDALPPDPRGGAVEVRAARFTVDGGALAYDVLLTRDKSGKPLNGVMQLLLAGTSTRGAETTAALKPVAISVDRYESVRGRLPLPDGFTPKQTTVQVLDRPDGKLLGKRVVYVR
ncbi:hypothetical protein [Piscinibacter sp.]|uniref:hypothetical protein n=1 Tax=Piscinibacter sp. TaxID=1903157 RepID=UPI002C986162|nr:hypothetical protein [Albitalea sp.]HUG24930.1 hypothetical protein [Albitalea sp.]